MDVPYSLYVGLLSFYKERPIVMKIKNTSSLFPRIIFLILSLLVLPSFLFASPPDSPYLPAETLAPSCAPGSANCTVLSVISSLGDPDQVLMVNSSGTNLEFRSPNSSLVPENGNLYYTDDRVGNYLATLMNNSNGIAGLDSSGKIPLSLIPDSLVGAVNYKGSWNASATRITNP